MGDDEIDYSQRLRDFGYHLVGKDPQAIPNGGQIQDEGQAIAGYMPVSWAAAVAAERERCAKIATSADLNYPESEWESGWNAACVEIAARIRSSGPKFS